MFSGICLSEPLVTHEASGVPIGSKNEFDLKHYINDLKCFETLFFQIGGGRTLFGKFHYLFFLFFLTRPLVTYGSIFQLLSTICSNDRSES